MATPEFLAKWRSKSGPLAMLARIVLPRVDATQTDTLYLSMADQPSYPDSSNGDPGRLWVGAVKSFGAIHMPGNFGSSDLHLATSSLVLRAEHVVTFPAGIGAAITETLRQSMATHVWLNATVTIWRYFHELGDFKHAQVVLSGAGVIEPSLEDDELVLSLRQMIPWNKPLTPRTVSKQEFARAPDSAVGLTLPIVYGDMATQPMRRPWTLRPTGNAYFSLLASKQGRYVKSVLTDPGRGGQATTNLNPKVHVAGHVLTSVIDEANGRLVWMETDNGLAQLMGTVTDPGYTGSTHVAVFNAAGPPAGAGFTIPDVNRYAMLSMIPAEIVTMTNQADGVRNLLDPNDVTCATFDYAGLKRRAAFKLQTPGNIADGTILMDTIVGYQSTAALADFNFYLDATNNGAGPFTLFANLPASTSPTISRTLFFGAGSAWPAASPWVAKLDFGASGAGAARVFFIGFVIYFRPVQEVIQSERIIGTQELSIQERVGPIVGLPYTVPTRTPAVTEVKGSFVASPVGYADSGGTYTGSGTTLIERSPDIMQHLLNVYGGVSLAGIERGASSFGSFVYARTLLRTNGVDPLHAMSISESTDVLTALLWLSGDSLTKPLVSPYDGVLRLVVWRSNAALDYATLLAVEDVNEPMGPDVSLTPTTDVVTDIRVSYAYDARERAYRSETSLAPDRSTAGYEYRSLRDGNLEVVPSVNDRLDFQSNSAAGGGFVVRAATLTAGVYLPQSSLPQGSGDAAEGMAQHIKAAMKTAEGTSSSRYQVTYGTKITTQYNDRISFVRGATIFNAVLPANDGTLTCDELAAIVQTTVNAASSAVQTNKFTCGYDRALQKYWVDILEVSPAWAFRCTSDGSDYASIHMQLSGWATLGFYQGGADATMGAAFHRLAEDVRIEEHFGVMSLGGSGGAPAPKPEFELLFQSGVNGADSASTVRHCADLLGFASSEDKLTAFSPAVGHSYCGDGPKGRFETQMKNSADLYGRRREVALSARTIQKGVAPRSLRNRLADLFRAPRPVISFTTRALPDIEQGQVFGFREEMPRPYPGPGSDGLWVGKKFAVVEYNHAAGPTSLDTQIVAVDIGTLATIVAAIGIGIVVGGAFIERLT